MNRRASLPGADELFRSTDARGREPREREHDPGRVRPLREAARGEPARSGESSGARSSLDDEPAAAVDGASGRVGHDQKITVYLTSQELLDLEQARLRLRAEFDIAVDRGRIVREAIAELLLNLHERGPDADLVRRLS